MSSDPEIIREETATGGRYVIHMPDGSEAEMVFKNRDDRTIIATHTGVPDQYRGQGLAFKLVARAISDARNSDMKIVPACTYVAAQFRRHPEWADLLAT